MEIKLNDLFKSILENLDITDAQYNQAVQSYTAVGNWLADEDSLLNKYKPEVLPQGSFLLGTMIKPINENDELDVDLVCRLSGKDPGWSQADLKRIVGDRIKENKTYKKMLAKEGRRCWTLDYADSTSYHMDILPSITSEDYFHVLEKAFSSVEYKDFNQTSIRITDKYEDNYNTDPNIENWKKSNPFGYAVWFQLRCQLELRKSQFLMDSVRPLPKKNEKLPLQRIVQILKRHRDLYFGNDEDKPISIIITTLASRAYNQESDIITGLLYVVNHMELFIEDRYDVSSGKNCRWIGNPINEEENFADKWVESRRKENIFFQWLDIVKKDVINLVGSQGRNDQNTRLKRIFGDRLVEKSLGNEGNTSAIISSTSTISGKVDKKINTSLNKSVPKSKREGFAY